MHFKPDKKTSQNCRSCFSCVACVSCIILYQANSYLYACISCTAASVHRRALARYVSCRRFAAPLFLHITTPPNSLPLNLYLIAASHYDPLVHSASFCRFSMCLCFTSPRHAPSPCISQQHLVCCTRCHMLSSRTIVATHSYNPE